MNRARQLKEALESCFACDLPKDTQFVIIDNASTDNTDEMVQELFESNIYTHYYERLPENLGVGGGRNYAFSKSSGEYVYFLDDDAYIDLSVDNLFFKKAIDILDSHPDIMSLTTQIYDNMMQQDRNSESKIVIEQGLYESFMMCGGSHFLRKSFFPNNAPFFGNKYGFEEFLPSLRIADAGKRNAYCPSLNVIHNPLVDKWSNNPELDILAAATGYAIKSMCYPLVVQPILRLSFWKRRKLYLKDKEQVRKTKRFAKEIKRTYSVGKRIKLITIVRLFHCFGMMVW